MAGGKQGTHTKHNSKSPKFRHAQKREAEANVRKAKPSTCKYKNLKELLENE